MRGPAPLYRPDFPPDFVAQARRIVHQRTVGHHLCLHGVLCPAAPEGHRDTISRCEGVQDVSQDAYISHRGGIEPQHGVASVQTGIPAAMKPWAMVHRADADSQMPLPRWRRWLRRDARP